jgi:tetratricopeptide (TPR) repeat protein
MNLGQEFIQIWYKLLLLIMAVASPFNSIAVSRDSLSVKKIENFNRQAIEEWSQGNFQKALDHITKAYEMAHEGGHEDQLAMVLNTLGLVYWRLGNNVDAMQSYVQSAELAEKLNMQRLLGLTHTNMGLIYKEQGDFMQAFRHNNVAIKIFRISKSYRDLGIACNNQGQIFKNMGRLDSARVYYQEALRQYEKIEYKDGEAATWYNLADIFQREGRMHEALDAANQSLEISRVLDSDLRISEAYQKLSQIYEVFGKPDSALKYFKLYYELNNKIQIINQSQRLSELQAELGAEVKNLQIENLRKEKVLAVNRNWLIGISALIIIIVAAFFVYRYLIRIRFRKENLEQELLNAAKIIEVKEQELKGYIIDLTRKNAIISKMQDEVTRTGTTVVASDSQVEQLLEQKILTDEDWTTFKAKFKAIYPGFFTRIKQYALSLTEAEERLLVLIYLDLSGREMANTLGISPQSVRVCKMRLKKKLQEKGIETVETLLIELVK